MNIGVNVSCEGSFTITSSPEDTEYDFISDLLIAPTVDFSTFSGCELSYECNQDSISGVTVDLCDISPLNFNQ